MVFTNLGILAPQELLRTRLTYFSVPCMRLNTSIWTRPFFITSPAMPAVKRGYLQPGSTPHLSEANVILAEFGILLLGIKHMDSCAWRDGESEQRCRR